MPSANNFLPIVNKTTDLSLLLIYILSPDLSFVFVFIYSLYPFFLASSIMNEAASLSVLDLFKKSL